MSKLDYEKIPRYKYRLLSGVIVRLSSDEFIDRLTKCPFLLLRGKELCFRTGYAWDGCTYSPDFKALMRASLVHDGLCQLIALGLLPSSYQILADQEFKRLAIEDGFKPWMAGLAYRAIRFYQSRKGK